MAKKRKRSQPVVAKKKADLTIHIAREDLPKERGAPIPPCQRFHNRDRAVHRGSRRNPKHKGKGYE